jgi:hypothetical protein
VYQHFFGSNNQFVDPEAFFWAISVLMSRATSGQDQPFTLIPFFDWFNHADNGYAAALKHTIVFVVTRVVSVCPSDECVQDFDPRKGFTVHTTKSYEPGEQLFISYGNHGNLRLLRNYGFTTPNNPYDVVSLPMPATLQQPRPADPAFAQKRELLLSATGSQADVPSLKTLRLQCDGRLAPNAEHWMEIMLATPDELDEVFRKAVSQATPGASPSTTLNPPMSLTHKVRAEVGKMVSNRLKTHSSTLEVRELLVRLSAGCLLLMLGLMTQEDEAFLNANAQQMAPWLRSCLHVRMGEKQTLVRAASKFA